MNMNIFKNLWYMARRFKVATTLNFIGLTVAFTACYLFLTQVVFNHSYNRGLADSKRIYRVETPSIMENKEWGVNINRAMADELAAMPQIEGMALFDSWHSIVSFRKDETFYDYKYCNVNDDALVTLAPRLVDGKLGWKDNDRQGIVIPASIAKAYFGTVQAAGRCMWKMSGKDSVMVRGVFEDFPENCLALNCIYANREDENIDNIFNWNYNCYVKLRENVDTTGLTRLMSKALEKKAHQIFIDNGAEEHWEEYQSKHDFFSIRLRPVSKTWFSGVDTLKDKGNRAVDIILQLSCLLVLLVAAINFLNFTLAESPMRIKSLTTRRILGSEVGSLRMGLVAEALTTSLLAYLTAVGVSYLLSQWPYVEELTVGSISLSDHPLLLLALALVAIIVGVASGLYPAWYATSFSPALAMKGSFGLTPQGKKLRISLLCLQFVITSVMVVYIGILYLQSHYIFHSDYGFSKDEVLETTVWELPKKHDALRSELMQLPGVEDVAFSQFVLGSQDQYMYWGRSDKKHSVNLAILPVDWHYLHTMGIEVTEGRDFNEHDGDCYIINEAARQQWEWVRMGQPLLEGDLPVVGVCRNVRFSSTRIDNNATPMAFIIMGEKYKDWAQLGMLNVRVKAGMDKRLVRQQVKDICTKLGAIDPEVKFLDQMLEDTYQEEFRFIRQVLVFSVICLIITLIGVFCMTMFETEYRRKEIGIRKVMGASTKEILSMLCRRYLWLLAISFVVAVPVAWHIGRQWLMGFAERTPIHWWLFPLALAVVSMVTLATVIIQSWRTANDNPINSIKSE